MGKLAFITALGYFSFGFLISLTQAQEDSLKTSVFEAMFANFDAWQNGDVLVKITETYDSLAESDSNEPSGIILKRTHFIRTIFDYQQQRFLQFELIDSSTTDFSSDHFAPNHESTWNGWTVDLKRNTALRNSNDSSDGETTLANEQDILNIYATFRDYRALPTIGLNAYGDTREKYVKATQSQLIGEKFVNAKDGVGNTIDVKFFLPFNEEFERKGVRMFARGMQVVNTFDKSSLMKIRERSDLVIGKVLPREEFVSESRFKWKEIDGIYVPLTYSLRNRQNIMVNGRQENVNASVSAKFHWFSLNERLPENCFNGSELENEKTFLKMVLPVKAGATSLLDDSKSDNVDQN